MNSHDDPQSTPGEPAGATNPTRDPAPVPPEASRPSPGFFGWIRGLNLVRGQDRWIGGVATGIAARTGLDPILVRGIFVVLAIFGGIGLLAYGLAWALLPEPDGRIHAESAGRGSWTSGMTGALSVTILGLWRPNVPFFGDTGGFGGFIWSLFWIGVAVFIVYWISNSANRNKAGAGNPAAGSPDIGTPGTQIPHTTQAGAATSAPADTAGPGASTMAHTVPLAWEQRNSPATAAMPHAMPPSFSQTRPQPRPPVVKSPPKPPTPRPSGADVAVFLGGAVLLAGLVLALDYLQVLRLGDSVVTVALATGVVVLGIGVVLLGLRGRSSGVLGFLASVGIVASLIASASPTTGHWVVASQGHWSSSAGAPADDGYTVVAGQGRIDLTELDALTEDLRIPVNAAAGNVGILIPEDVPVEVRSMVALSSTDTVTPIDSQSIGGIWQPGTMYLNEDADGPSIILDVRGVVSHITVSTNESALEDTEGGQER